MQRKELFLIVALVLALFVVMNGLNIAVANVSASSEQESAAETCPQQGQRNCPNYETPNCPRFSGDE